MTWLGLIWAQSRNGVIGAQGGIPWHVPEDLAHFKEVTLGAPVIMGRKTWDSLPERFRPLPGRDNIVITRQQDWSADGARRATSVADAAAGLEQAWIMGGAEIYAHTISEADRLEVTEIDLEVEGDAVAPSVDGWRCVSQGDWLVSRTGVRYRFCRYER